MYCVQCGTAATVDGKFCSKCGTLLVTEPSKAPSGGMQVAEIVPDRDGLLHKNLSLYLAALLLIGAYAAILIPAFAGETNFSNSTLGLILVNGVFFYLLWKRLTVC